MYRSIDEYPETFDDLDADYCCDECEVHDADEAALLARLDATGDVMIDLGMLALACGRPSEAA